MASCSFNSTGRTFTLEVVETSYSVASNTSNIRWTLSISGGGSTWYNSYVKATVNGSVVYNETRNWQSGTFPAKDGSVSGTITGIGHDSQGYKSISFAIEGYSEVYTTQYANGSLTLTAIPRKAEVTSATDFNDEQNPTIRYNNPGGLRINARLEFAGTEIQRDNIGNSGTYTFNLTDAERDLLRQKCTGKTMTVREVIATCISGTTEQFWSWQDKTMTIVNGNPVFPATSVSYEDTNDDVVEITEDNQMIVRNNSNLQVTFGEATALKNASISRYEVIFKGQTRTFTNPGTVDLGVVNLSQDSTLVVKAIDSRGNSTSVSKTVKILDWVNPTATISAGRVNNYEDETKLKVSTTISYVDNKNEVKSIVYRYKKTSDTTYSQDFPLSDNVETTIVIDKLYAWDFQVVITDCFGSTIYNFIITKGTPIMFVDVNKLSVGINSFPRNSQILGVGGDLRSDGSIISELYAPYDYTQEDLTKVYNYIHNTEQLTPQEIKKYDVNKDGEITYKDYVIISNFITDGITTTNSFKLKLKNGEKSSDMAFVLENANGNEIAKINRTGYYYNGIPFSNNSFYSTNEIKIGQWIDGKPLYRKVLDEGQYTWINGTNTFNHNINNLDTLINLEYTMQWTNGRWYKNWDMLDTQNWTVGNTTIEINCSGTTTFNQLYLILEYTKTTD